MGIHAHGWSIGPYGELLTTYTSGYLPLTGYTGHLQTEPTGLIYMRGRFYSPAWHRFMNSDQGVDPNSINQFGYCIGNPLMLTDASGYDAGGQRPEQNGYTGSGYEKGSTMQGASGSNKGSDNSDYLDAGTNPKHYVIPGTETTAKLFMRPTGSTKPQCHGYWGIKSEDGSWQLLSGGQDTTTGRVRGWVTNVKSEYELSLAGWKGAPSEDIAVSKTVEIRAYRVDSKYGTSAGANALNDRFNATTGTQKYQTGGPNSNTYAREIGEMMGVKTDIDKKYIDSLLGW